MLLSFPLFLFFCPCFVMFCLVFFFLEGGGGALGGRGHSLSERLKIRLLERCK